MDDGSSPLPGRSAACRAATGRGRWSWRPTWRPPAARRVIDFMTGASGADEELLRLLGLADPVHLDDDHAFAADVGQVDEHQRASLDGAQSRRLACELPPVEEDHRFADGQFLGYLTDRCQGGRWQPVEQVIGDEFPMPLSHPRPRSRPPGRCRRLPELPDPGQRGQGRRGLVRRRGAGRRPRGAARWRWRRPSAGRSGGWGRRCPRRRPG